MTGKILIVDDEPDVRELFNITLKMAGFATTTARDGLEGIESLNDGLPDLIVLDLMMPNLDGFGFLERLRKEMEDDPLRVLVATAKLLEEADHTRLSSWPVVGVLNKGELDIGRMVTVVTKALEASPRKSGAIIDPPTSPRTGIQSQKTDAPKKPATIRTNTGSRVRRQKQ